MKQKIALVVTSSGVVSKESLEKHNMYLAPMDIIFDDKTYKDLVEMPHEEFYKKVRLGNFPKTSLPNPLELEELFRKLLKEYDHVIYLTIASALSGTYENGRVIAEEVDPKRITVYDTETTAIIEGYMQETAARLIKEGKTVSEIIKALDALKEKWKVYFVVEDLKYLQINGRIGKAASFVAGILNIVPILQLTREGVDAFEKVRTSKKAFARLLELCKEANLKETDPIFIVHADSDKNMLNDLYNKIKELYPKNKIQTYLLTPTIGAHTGPGVFAVGWYKL